MSEQKLSVMPSEMLVIHVTQFLKEIERPRDVAWRFVQWDQTGLSRSPSPNKTIYNSTSVVNVFCEHWMRLAGGIGEMQETLVQLHRNSIAEIGENPVYYIGQCSVCKKVYWWANPMLRSREVDVNGT